MQYNFVLQQGGIMLSVRLSTEAEHELGLVAHLEHTTKTHIVREAIAEFLQKRKQKKQYTPYLLGHDLFGVYEGEESLSQEYKTRLDDMLHAKYDHH